MEAEQPSFDVETAPDEGLASLATAAARYRIAVGPLAGQRTMRLRVPTLTESLPLSQGTLAASHDGFSLWSCRTRTLPVSNRLRSASDSASWSYRRWADAVPYRTMIALQQQIGIHLGLPKCASTSLQARMAESCPERYLGKFPVTRDDKFEDDALDELLREKIVYEPASTYDYAAAEHVLQQVVDEHHRDAGQLLLSDELLSGFGFLNIPRRRVVDPALIFERLARLFARPRILIVFREQHTFLRSYYAELVRFGYNVFFDRFLQAQITSSLGLATLLRYDRYRALAQRYFEDVVVIPMEAIIGAEPRALDLLAEFGVNGRNLPALNVSKSPDELLIQLRSNLEHPIRFGRHSPVVHVPGVAELDARCAQMDDPLFHTSHALVKRWDALAVAANRALDQQTGWHLEHFGYRV